MNARRNVYAVVPIKETGDAKQRLAPVLGTARRQELALAMFEDVLATLARVRELAGIIVVTTDSAAGAIASRYGARVSSDGAREGHTGAVAAAARQLAADDMLTVPGDVPLVETNDIRQLLKAHGDATCRDGRAFVIVPARDERGSNAIVCSPAGAVPLTFSADSFLPHLAAAKRCGIEPTVLRLPRVALDIDTPDDMALFLATPSQTRARALLEQVYPSSFRGAPTARSRNP
ncbi:MAG TPA: 2-phospho-L-lactate guanylyltransferase [Casimicrobiaceae bacterium]